MASKLLTPDQQNFTRLVIVCVDLIKLVLKDVLESTIKPADLYHAISNCAELTSGHRKLRPEQQRLCYLPAPNVPDYLTFDVSLLYSLIRNLCPNLKPTLGWGKTPSHMEIQIGDDIERLRIFRNDVHGHCESSNVTDTEFSSRWLDIETAIRRVEALFSSQGLSVNYKKELKKIKDLDLGSEDMDKYKLLLEGMMCLLKKSENEDMPKILIHGKDKVTCGEVACFKVDVESSSMAAPWSVTWQRVRGDITEQINISTEKYRDSNDRQLVIQRVSKADEGGYQAVLSRHNLKVTSNSIFLVATGDPPVLQTMDVSTGRDGITLHYQYTVTSHSPNVHHIAWTKNGNVVNIDHLKYKGGGIHDGRLTITSPTAEDAGQYTCTVSNDVADVSQSLTLDIPSVTVSDEVPVYVGSETKIVSVVAACPPPEGAAWQKSSDSVTFENINMDDPRHYGSTKDPSSPVLTITKATFDDKLYYRLLVWNKIGQCVSNTVYLNVTGAPPNISNSQETNIQNRSVTLTCEIFLYENSPMLLEVCWMKNNHVLDIAGSGGKLAGGTITSPSLVINNVNEFDAGSYQCKASNAVGSTLGNIIVLGIPDVDVREHTTNDTQVFTTVLTSIPAPIEVQWSVKNELTGDWAPVDTNSEEYKGTNTSLPQPVLVVKRKERIKIHSFQMTVKNFIGIKTKLIPDGRTCVQNDKGDPKDDALHPIFSKKGSTIRFNNLLLQIVDEIPQKDLGTLKRSLGVMTSTRTALSNVTSVGEFIDCLLEEELVKERNVIMMQYLLRSIKRPDLDMKCVEYATMNKQALCYYEEINISGDRHKEIKLHVVNNIDNFNDMDSLLATVASIVGCEPSSIKVVGIHPENSFIIMMMVKMEFARVLLQKDQKELMELLKFNVDWIQIEDKVIKIQQSKLEELPEHSGKMRKIAEFQQKHTKIEGKPEEHPEHSGKMRTIAEFQQKHTKIEGKPEELPEHSGKMRKIAEFQQKHTKIEGKPEELPEHSGKMRTIAEFQQKHTKIEGKPEELPEHSGKMRKIAEFQQKHTKIEGKLEEIEDKTHRDEKDMQKGDGKPGELLGHLFKTKTMEKHQQKHKKVASPPTKEKILCKFKDWLELQYKDVRIVHAYIGRKMDSKYPALFHEDVVVVVIDAADVIQHETFEDSGKTFQIVCKLWRYPSSEGVIVSNREKERTIPEEKQMQIERCLKRNSNDLFKRHSNIEIISASAFRSKNNGEELVFDPCIVLYCSCKRVLPWSEEEFPKIIDGIKTDVREGFFYLFPNDHFFKRSTDLLNPLMVGANIGKEGQNKEGTLGGFVTLNNDEIGAITCSHLFFDVNSNNASVTAFNVVQPSYGYKNTNEICGKHEKSVSPSDRAHGVTLDVSLIRLTDRIPQRGLFADLKANDLAELGFTHNKLPEYSKGGTRDYRKEQKNRMNACIKCGTGSGLSRGLLHLNGLAARCRDTTFSLTNPPSQAQCTFLSQLEVSGTPQKAFAAAGDSGALVFQVDPPSTEDGDDELVCIGMVVGGTSYYTTAVTPIQPILEALNVRMHVFAQEEMDIS